MNLTIDKIINEGKPQWLGHIERMTEERESKNIALKTLKEENKNQVDDVVKR